MKLYLATFEYSRTGMGTPVTAMAHNTLAGVVRCARAFGLKAKRINGSWQFWRPNPGDKPAVYTLRNVYPI